MQKMFLRFTGKKVQDFFFLYKQIEEQYYNNHANHKLA